MWKLLGQKSKIARYLIAILLNVIVFSCLSSELTSGIFSVAEGDTFSYDIIEAFIDSSMGDEFHYNEGVWVELVRIPVSSVVDITVDDVTDTSVVYTLSYGSLNHHDTCDYNIITPSIKLIAYGLTMPIMLMEQWDSLFGTAFAWWGEPFIEWLKDIWWHT